jgi:hypothetical protein
MMDRRSGRHSPFGAAWLAERLLSEVLIAKLEPGRGCIEAVIFAALI